MPDHLFNGLTLATMAEGANPYGLMENGAVAVKGEHIAWAGPLADLPAAHADYARTDFGGRLATPGLIDCHTHLVHGGDRANEFEMRLNGASYADIARAGGGILSTVKATRAASEDELLAAALTRADTLIAEGVTTLEIKSGYGLDRDSELKMLRAARALGRARPVHVVTTYLGAHATPPEYAGRTDAYLDEVVLPTLERAAGEGLVDAVDGFCEGIAFSPEQIERLFARAEKLGLPVKLHAEQLSNLHGAALAARHGALSADHLEWLDEAGAEAMARAGTVAVLLPGAFYTLRETKLPPIDLLRRHGVRMAVATDCNPGTSPLTSMLLAMNMAATLFRLTPEESLAGATRHAARALGLVDRGMIVAGQRADLAIWDVGHPRELAWRIGFNPLHARIFGGLA